MRTDIADRLGIEVPVFAFSHCRDVVAAVSKAGGLGVLGAAWMTAEELEISLNWLESELAGKPFGVDLVFPGTGGEEKEPAEYLSSIPPSHLQYVDTVLDEAGIATMSEPDVSEFMLENANRLSMTQRKSRAQLEISLSRPSVKAVVGALGVTPEWVVDEAHARGVLVGALVGSGRHAAKQRSAGVDFLVAQGTEAGGSVGSISSMVLWPQVVEAAQGLPVLAAGGVSRGSQVLAALALGCQGVWIGSLWLGTAESELSEATRQRLFDADSEDAVISLAMTGKQGRMLRTKYVDAWQTHGAPGPLSWPMQSILWGYANMRAERGRELDYWTYSVGQMVGDLHRTTTVQAEVTRLITEYLEALDRLHDVTTTE